MLFLLTARYHVAVLSYDTDSRDVVTRAYGDVKVSLLVLSLHTLKLCITVSSWQYNLVLHTLSYIKPVVV